MAKRKTAIATLIREVFPNGNIKLSSPKGIMDIRSESIYSEVVCKPSKERYFVECQNTESEAK